MFLGGLRLCRVFNSIFVKALCLGSMWMRVGALELLLNFIANLVICFFCTWGCRLGINLETKKCGF
ncbi:hypothetical protein REPUB_Repub02eG0225700 [Reevesia pubescens]